MQIELPLNKEVYKQTMLMTGHQKKLNYLMSFLGDTMTKSGKKMDMSIILINQDCR